MITFNDIGNYGRLGNQLFQYAILKSVSKKTGYEIVLPNLNGREWHGQKCLLDSFKLPSCNFINPTTTQQYTERHPRSYDENIFTIGDNTNFHGFFQHPKYYIDIVDDLRTEFELMDPIQEKVDNYLSQFDKPTVSLHLRRGDASDGTNPIDNDWINDFSEGSILHNYYSTALKMVPEDSIVLLFTGGSRKSDDNTSDLNWCRERFNDDRIIFVEGLSDIESFGVMKQCDHNITSFASTFSWWASFLNRNNNVIAPKNYYPTHPTNIESVYPDSWLLI